MRFLVLLLCTHLLFADVESLENLLGSSCESWFQNKERWEFDRRYEDQRDQVLEILETMGFFEQKNPSASHYNYGVVLGSLAPKVQQRMEFLIFQYEQGVTFDHIVFLTGQRPLHPTETEFTGQEVDMMIALWQKLSMPQELRDTPLIIVNAPPLPEKGRPTTESTLETWFKSSPNPGTALFVSNQPYVLYQDAVIKSLAPKGWTIETIGEQGGQNLPISILLDTVFKYTSWRDKQSH